MPVQAASRHVQRNAPRKCKGDARSGGSGIQSVLHTVPPVQALDGGYQPLPTSLAYFNPEQFESRTDFTAGEFSTMSLSSSPGDFARTIASAHLLAPPPGLEPLKAAQDLPSMTAAGALANLIAQIPANEEVIMENHIQTTETTREEYPSRGSKNHAAGQCRPCKYFLTPNGCAAGHGCNHCHYSYGHEKRTTPPAPAKPQPEITSPLQQVLSSPPSPPPSPLESRMSSRGSKNHQQGMCKPCRFLATPAGCAAGQNCNHCHLRHAPPRSSVGAKQASAGAAYPVVAKQAPMRSVPDSPKDDALPSRGSKNHFSGACRPCGKLTSEGGCPMGHGCNHCHYPHGQERRLESALFSLALNYQRTSEQLAQMEQLFVQSESGRQEMARQLCAAPWPPGCFVPESRTSPGSMFDANNVPTTLIGA